MNSNPDRSASRLEFTLELLTKYAAAHTPNSNQDTDEILSLFDCCNNYTAKLAPSTGDRAQTNGLERLKRVAVTWPAKGVLRE